MPTIWAGPLDYIRSTGVTVFAPPGGRGRLRGAARDDGEVREELGVRLLQAWGMTETSPLASVAHVPACVSPADEWSDRDSQGRLVCAVEGRLPGDGGALLPSDGEAVGEVEVRDPGSPAFTIRTTTRPSSTTAGCAPATWGRWTSAASTA